MKEPLSTLSNAFYGIVSLIIFYGGVTGDLSLGAISVALSAGVLCLASGLYHATLTRENQAFDEVAMYILLGSLIGLGLSTITGLHMLSFFIWILTAVVSITQWERMDSFVWVPSMAAVVAVLVGVIGGPLTALGLFGIFAVSGGIRQLGKRYTGRVEELFHSAWHLGTAVAIYLAFSALQ